PSQSNFALRRMTSLSARNSSASSADSSPLARNETGSARSGARSPENMRDDLDVVPDHVVVRVESQRPPPVFQRERPVLPLVIQVAEPGIDVVAKLRRELDSTLIVLERFREALLAIRDVAEPLVRMREVRVLFDRAPVALLRRRVISTPLRDPARQEVERGARRVRSESFRDQR